MTRRDAVELRVADFCRGDQRAINYRPTSLQRSQVALGKGAPGQISRHDR